MPKYGPITSCQSCGADRLESVLYLGQLPPCNVLHEIGTPLDKEDHFPAELLYCTCCHLVQIGYAADPSIIFPPSYPYTSGSTRILRENFADLYAKTAKMLGLNKDDLIVDIGSNDGTLLSNFKNGGHRVIGVEPTLTYKIAEERGIPSINKFFGKDAVDEILNRARWRSLGDTGHQHEYTGHATVVTAANVFAHIHDIHEILAQIERLLLPDGVFISESHYLGGLLETNQYDTIYHEHLRYYSYTSLQNLLSPHGFTIFHVDRIPTHGGSIRCYASKTKRDVDDSVSKLFNWEIDAGLTAPMDRVTWITKFRDRVRDSKLHLYKILTGIKEAGEEIVGIGAPSRASTLISYTGLDDTIISAVLEISTSKKLNKYMPGTKIPILDEEMLYREQPKWALLLSWHIAEEMMENLRRKGYKGNFIIPLPEPRVIAQPK